MAKVFPGGGKKIAAPLPQFAHPPVTADRQFLMAEKEGEKEKERGIDVKSQVMLANPSCLIARGGGKSQREYLQGFGTKSICKKSHNV